MARSLDEAPFVNPFDPDIRDDPEPTFNALRAEASVARTPMGVTVLRRDAVQALLLDQRLVSAVPFLTRIQGISDDDISTMVDATVLAMDGPDHARLRRLVARSFTPPAADRHRPIMHQLVDELVSTFEDRNQCEFVADFADHYPVQVICEVLGVPREDHDRFARWGDSLTYLLSMELATHIEEVADASTALNAYVDALIADRSTSPRDDLVTELVQASEGGDRLSPVELRAMIGALLFAGYDTTRNQLGHAMALFCDHPDQWVLLAEQPELATAAVNEVMRIGGAVAVVPRVTTEDIEVDGWLIPASTVTILSVASANRDDASGERPLSFDITADRAPHLTFGAGPHHCLCASLARAEMEEALRILPRRMPNLRIDGEPTWRLDTGIRGPTYLPLRFGKS
jgi:cytochrome P450